MNVELGYVLDVFLLFDKTPEGAERPSPDIGGFVSQWDSKASNFAEKMNEKLNLEYCFYRSTIQCAKTTISSMKKKSKFLASVGKIALL